MNAHKLEKIKYHRTLYEIVAENEKTKETFLVVYCGRSFSRILNAITDNDFARLHKLATKTNTSPESWKVTKRKIYSGDWTIKATGRTQRDCYIENETESIY